jgi:hypothetical protein
MCQQVYYPLGNPVISTVLAAPPLVAVLVIR